MVCVNLKDIAVCNKSSRRGTLAAGTQTNRWQEGTCSGSERGCGGERVTGQLAEPSQRQSLLLLWKRGERSENVCEVRYGDATTNHPLELFLVLTFLRERPETKQGNEDGS